MSQTPHRLEQHEVWKSQNPSRCKEDKLLNLLGTQQWFLWVFIENYTSGLCPLLHFRLWLGFAYQFIAICFLFLQYLQEYTGTWATWASSKPEIIQERQSQASAVFCPWHGFCFPEPSVFCPWSSFYSKGVTGCLNDSPFFRPDTHPVWAPWGLWPLTILWMWWVCLQLNNDP